MGNLLDVLLEIKQRERMYEEVSSLWLRKTYKQKRKSSDKQDDVKEKQENKNKHQQGSKANH